MSARPKIVTVSLKPTRNRGATWTDNHVRWLLQLWSRPDIMQRQRKSLFVTIASELSKLDIKRTPEECRTKLKNLNSEFRKAKDCGQPHIFKFYSTMQKILDKMPPKNNGFIRLQETATTPPVSPTAESSLSAPPVHIEFQLMDCDNPSPIIVDAPSFEDDDEEFAITPEDDDNESTPVIVITTSTSQQNDLASESNKRPLINHDSSSYYGEEEGAGGSGGTSLRTKRQKLQSLGDKLAERVTRVLTQSTDSLISEMRQSEERFMRWEEERRKEERQREEAMVKRLVQAIQKPPPNSASNREQLNEDNDLVDPITQRFEKATKDLKKKMEGQWSDLENSLDDWERRMGRQEINHTQSIFDILIHSINPSS